MSRFTINHSISLDCTPSTYGSKPIFSAYSDGALWIHCNTYEESNSLESILRFDIETHKPTKVKCNFPAEYAADYTSYMFSHNNEIYMWRTDDVMMLEPELILIKLDKMTMTWVEVVRWTPVEVDPRYIRKVTIKWTPIINNSLYMLHQKANSLELIVIDLKARRNGMKKYKLDTERGSKYCSLMLNEDKLYLVQHIPKYNQRIVSIIEDGELRVVEDDEYRLREERLVPYTECKNGTIIYGHTNSSKPFLFMDTFDFNTNRWSSTVIEKPWGLSDENEFESVTINNGSIYGIIKDGQRFNVRVIEKEPSLETLCVLNAADDYIRNKDTLDLADIVGRLPIHIGIELQHMIHWRTKYSIGVEEEYSADEVCFGTTN